MASPYQILYTHRQYDDVQKTINYYLNKANGNYNLAASQYPYGPNAFNELVKYRDTLQAQLSDLNNYQASINLFGKNNRAPYVSAKAGSTKVYPAYEPPQSKSITQSINLYEIEPTVKTPVVNVPTEQEYEFYDTLEQVNSLSDAIKFIPGLVAGMGKVIDFPKPVGVVTKTPTKGGILKYVLPAIAGGAGFGVSWVINKNYGKYAPNYEQTNAGVPPIYPSPNSSSFQISNDIYRTLFSASLFSRMQNFEQFSKSSGDIGPTINRPDTKTQEYSKILGTWTLPIVFGGYSIKNPKTGIPLALTSAGGALLGQNLAKNNPPNYSFKRLFNYNDLAPYAKLGAVVMTTDYNGRPYLLFPELVYKEGKPTPTGRFSHYISLYDKDSIQQVAGNNIQVARDDTKRKYIYYFTPTGNMSAGALPIAFVNTTPQIVNDIFNDIEGSYTHQLTTKVSGLASTGLDIMDYYKLGDVNEFIPEFYNLFKNKTSITTTPASTDTLKTKEKNTSGNNSGKGSGGSGNNNVSDSQANRDAILNYLENMGKWGK